MSSWCLSSVYLDIFLSHKQSRIILGMTHVSVLLLVKTTSWWELLQGYFSVEALWFLGSLCGEAALICCSVTISWADTNGHRWVVEQLLCLLRVTPNVQPGQMLFTWRSGSWAELRGWKTSPDASRGSSSADAAQSRSWRWCSWHKTRWLCQGSGALRQKEEWSDEVLQFVFC